MSRPDYAPACRQGQAAGTAIVLNLPSRSETSAMLLIVALNFNKDAVFRGLRVARSPSEETGVGVSRCPSIVIPAVAQRASLGSSWRPADIPVGDHLIRPEAVSRLLEPFTQQFDLERRSAGAATFSGVF